MVDEGLDVMTDDVKAVSTHPECAGQGGQGTHGTPAS